MSLIVAAALACGGFFVGRWVMRPQPGSGSADASTKGGKAVASALGGTATTTERADPFAEFPCRLGDVILRLGGDEAWLAGALVLSEEVPIAAIFLAPDAGGDRAIYVRPRPNASLAWLEAIPPTALLLGSEPPSAVEHAGTWFERLRRLPVRAERVGSGAPDVGEQVILAEYGASGAERLVVVVASGVARAWRGVLLDDGAYDVLPSGKGTLEADGDLED